MVRYSTLTLPLLVNLAASPIWAQDRLHVFVLLDLSGTQKSTRLTSSTELQENIRVVEVLAASLPPAARLTISPITNQSWANAVTLMDARTPRDPGPLSSKLSTARRLIVGTWKQRSHELTASYTETDLVGAFLFAGEVLGRSSADRKVIVLLSDARNFSKQLDLETPEKILVEKNLKSVAEQNLLAELSGVEVYFFGAGDHSGKRSNEYTRGLESFWKGYIEQSGGLLKTFSTARDGIAQSVADLRTSKVLK